MWWCHRPASPHHYHACTWHPPPLPKCLHWWRVVLWGSCHFKWRMLHVPHEEPGKDPEHHGGDHTTPVALMLSWSLWTPLWPGAQGLVSPWLSALCATTLYSAYADKNVEWAGLWLWKHISLEARLALAPPFASSAFKNMWIPVELCFCLSHPVDGYTWQEICCARRIGSQ